jgi:hypothetical protein
MNLFYSQKEHKMKDLVVVDYERVLTSFVARLLYNHSWNDLCAPLTGAAMSLDEPDGCPEELTECAKKMVNNALLQRIPQKENTFVVEDMSNVNSVFSALTMIEKEHPTPAVKELVAILRHEITNPGEEEDESEDEDVDDESDAEEEDIDEEFAAASSYQEWLNEEAMVANKKERAAWVGAPVVDEPVVSAPLRVEEEQEEIDVEKEVAEAKILSSDQEVLLERTKQYIEELIGKKATAKVTQPVRGSLKEVKRKIEPQMRPTVFDNLLSGDLDLTVDDMQELSKKAIELSKANRGNKNGK